jgi:hypothetical protein
MDLSAWNKLKWWPDCEVYPNVDKVEISSKPVVANATPPPFIPPAF